MQVLRVLVVVMGVMIVAGVVVIAVTIAKRAGLGSQQAETPGSAATADFGESSIELPPGAEIVGELLQGDNLVLKTRLGSGEIGYLIVDIASGRTRGSLRIGEAR